MTEEITTYRDTLDPLQQERLDFIKAGIKRSLIGLYPSEVPQFLDNLWHMAVSTRQRMSNEDTKFTAFLVIAAISEIRKEREEDGNQ